MLARRPDSQLPTLTAEPATPLATALAALKKPNRLVIAEGALRRVRETRAEIAGRHAALCRAALNADQPRDAKRQIAEAGAELEAADVLIVEARAKLQAERETWRPAAAKALAEPVAETVDAALAVLDRLAALADDLRQAGRTLERDGLADHAPFAIRYSGNLAHAIREVRACLKGNS